jgi:hypothetical protein
MKKIRDAPLVNPPSTLYEDFTFFILPPLFYSEEYAMIINQKLIFMAFCESNIFRHRVISKNHDDVTAVPQTVNIANYSISHAISY